MKMPLRQGQSVELNFPRTEGLAEDKGGFARIKSAQIVRIDRSDALESGAVRVGLVFSEDGLIPTQD